MHDEDNDETAGGTLAEVFAAAAGAGLQLVTAGDPLGAVAGAMVPVAFLSALRIDAAAQRRRLARAAQALESASSELDVELPELERRALETERTTALVGRVLAAAANAVETSAKIDALGRALASGLASDDKLDEALVLAAALDDLEAPHVRLLVEIGPLAWDFGDEDPDDPNWYLMDRHSGRDYTLGELMGAAGGQLSAMAVISLLARHGLVVQTTTSRADLHNPGQPLTVQAWAPTGLAVSCLQLLRAPVPLHRRRNPMRDLLR